MAKPGKKVQALMDTARELFWKHGLKRVSVEEICNKADVSKMTFYRHFENKTDLAKAVYDDVIDGSLKKFKGIMSDESTTTEEKMEAMLNLKLEGTHEISREFLHDFYGSPELGLVDFINRRSQEIWQEMIRDFKTAQDKGWFRKDFKPEVFFIVSQKMADLISDEKLLALYDTPQDLIMELSKLFTYGIISHKK
jgi:AcrR family transcriptional regulator